MKETKKNPIYQMTAVAVMTAVTCVLAPFSLPIGPVPVSLGTLALYLTLYILNWKQAAVSALVYLLLGFVGMPVFAGFTGGIAKLAGPTGGYLVGYLPMVILAGVIMSKTENPVLRFGAMIAGTAVLYAVGTAWFCILTGTELMAALSMCVFPFLLGDLGKMAAALLIGTPIAKQLKQNGIL